MKSTKAGNDERPICPYCEKELDEIKTKEFDKGKLTLLSHSFIYICPHCRKVLAIGKSE
jgi:uncharacterized protein with PIN domain